MVCCCTLAGTRACLSCSNSPFSEMYLPKIHHPVAVEPIDYDKLAKKLVEFTDKDKE